MLELMFGFKPRWFDKVLAGGTPASAEVISDPKDVMKGVAGYHGGERYLNVVVRVGATYDGVHEQKMKTPLTTVLGGILEPGMEVNVKYDAADPTRIVLADDLMALLTRRVRPVE
jgi:hypothetical protein